MVRKERCPVERRLGLALDLAHAVALFVERHRKEALEEVEARGRATVVESRPVGGFADRAGVQITSRQRDVLKLMEDGLSDAAIGARLHLSVKTVNTHAYRLYRLLGASSRTEAVSLARRLDLL